MLHRVEEDKCFFFGELHTVDKDTWVHAFTEEAFGLTHELTDEEDISGGAVTNDIVLSGGGAADHRSGGVLDLHFVEEDATVFGKFDLASTANEHLNCAFGS